MFLLFQNSVKTCGVQQSGKKLGTATLWQSILMSCFFSLACPLMNVKLRRPVCNKWNTGDVFLHFKPPPTALQYFSDSLFTIIKSQWWAVTTSCLTQSAFPPSTPIFPHFPHSLTSILLNLQKKIINAKHSSLVFPACTSSGTSLETTGVWASYVSPDLLFLYLYICYPVSLSQTTLKVFYLMI